MSFFVKIKKFFYIILINLRNKINYSLIIVIEKIFFYLFFFKIRLFPSDFSIRMNVNFNGINVFFSPSSYFTYARYKQFERGEKEPKTIKWINNFRKKDIFFDVGANVGIFSIYAKKKIGCRVFAFEPEVLSFVDLYKCADLNKVKICCVMGAVSNDNRLQNFNYSNKIYSAGLSNHSVSEKESKNHYKINAFSLDSFSMSHKIIPNHVKIDVDGNEKKIVMGMKNILKNTLLRSILIEINSYKKKIFLINYLKKLNFNILDIEKNNYLFSRY